MQRQGVFGGEAQITVKGGGRFQALTNLGSCLQEKRRVAGKIPKDEDSRTLFCNLPNSMSPALGHLPRGGV